MSERTWEHKGIKIEVHQFGEFVALVDETKLDAATLDGVRKKIDKALKTISRGNRVKVFVREYVNQWESGEVTSRGADSYGNPHFWVSYTGQTRSHQRAKVTVNDLYRFDEAKAETYRVLSEQIEKLKNQRQELLDELKYTLPELLADMGLPIEEE